MENSMVKKIRRKIQQHVADVVPSWAKAQTIWRSPRKTAALEPAKESEKGVESERGHRTLEETDAVASWLQPAACSLQPTNQLVSAAQNASTIVRTLDQAKSTAPVSGRVSMMKCHQDQELQPNAVGENSQSP